MPLGDQRCDEWSCLVFLSSAAITSSLRSCSRQSHAWLKFSIEENLLIAKTVLNKDKIAEKRDNVADITLFSFFFSGVH